MSTSTLTISMADVLVRLRERLIEALNQRDEASLNSIESALNAIEETIIALHPHQGNRLLRPVDHMISTIGDYFHGSTAKSTLPDEAEIRAAFAEVRTVAGEKEKSTESAVDQEWVRARLEGKITRDSFLDALKSVILNTPVMISVREPEELYSRLLTMVLERLQVELTQKSLRNPPESLIHYASIAEQLATDRIGSAEKVPFATAQEIVQAFVRTIH